MNNPNIYGGEFKGLFFLFLLCTVSYFSLKHIFFKSDSKDTHNILEYDSSFYTARTKRVSEYKIEDFKKGNETYYLLSVKDKYIINTYLNEKFPVPIYIDEFVIHQDSNYSKPYVSGFTDSTEDLFDGQDKGIYTKIKIKYKYNYVPIFYQNN